VERARPRSFDADAVLDTAMSLFWARGYQCTSLSDLLEATGLNKASLYEAFGDKEQLYLKALARYGSTQGTHAVELLNAEPDVAKAIEVFFRSNVVMVTETTRLSGCLVVTGSSACGTGLLPEKIDLALQGAHHGVLETIAARLERAKIEGQLDASANTGALAQYVATVVAGLAVKAKLGAPREQLNLVVDWALRALPLKPAARSGRLATAVS